MTWKKWDEDEWLNTTTGHFIRSFGSAYIFPEKLCAVSSYAVAYYYNPEERFVCIRHFKTLGEAVKFIEELIKE